MKACVNPYCELHKTPYNGESIYRKIIPNRSNLFANRLHEPDDFKRKGLIIDTKILKYLMNLDLGMGKIISFNIVICEYCERSLPYEILKIFKNALVYACTRPKFTFDDSSINELMSDCIRKYYNQKSFNESKQWIDILLRKRSIINAPINPNVDLSKESTFPVRNMVPRYTQFYDVLPNDKTDTGRELRIERSSIRYERN